MYAGTFLICLAVLAYEILSVRTLAFVLGSGNVYFVIALAMLGLSAAGSLLSIVRLEDGPEQRNRTVFCLCFALAICVIATYYGSSLIKDVLNIRVASAGITGGMSGIVKEMLKSGIYATLVLGALLSLPYFLFGAILTLLFRSVRDDQYHKLYFSDLLGGAVGCVLAFCVMETASYAAALLVPPMLCLGAAAAFVYTTSRRLAAVALVSSAVVFVWPHTGLPLGPIEPKPQLNDLARNYDLKRDVRELWRGWNSFSRVAALEAVVPGTGQREHIMALGNGEGHADLIKYEPRGYRDWSFLPSKLAVMLARPKMDALVLFAGTGADMMAIDAYTEGQAKITGVELNHTMIEGALALKRFELSAFYSRPGISMKVDEARAFLERDPRKYDVILLSFSGATTSYYAGSMGHTTQFVYTREAMESLLDHLKPDGYLVYMNTNKVNTLATFRDILEERGRRDAANGAIVAYRPGTESSRWDRWWDENPAILKPSGFTAAEVAHVADYVKKLGLAVAYAPHLDLDPAYWPYSTVLKDADLTTALDNLNRRTNLRFSVVTDDRPFSFDLFRTSRYLQSEFWQKVRSPRVETAYERYRVQQLAFVGAIIAAAAVLILGPLAFTRGPGWNVVTLNHLLFFSALGAGFMFIEIGLMHKMSLLLGNPGLSIAVVLAGLIVFTGVGSLVSDRAFASGWTFRKTVLLIIGLTAVYLLAADPVLRYVMQWPLWAKPLVVVGMVIPFGVAMGQLMPQGLVRARQDDTALVPWAWAINGALGTIAAGLAPLIAQMSGFKSVVALGAACYCVILLLPRYANK